MGRLAELSHLEDLDVNGTQVTDEGLGRLRNLRELRGLSVGGPQITDKGLASLAELRGLRDLSLSRTGVTDDGVRTLQHALPQPADQPLSAVPLSVRPTPPAHLALAKTRRFRLNGRGEEGTLPDGPL